VIGLGPRQRPGARATRTICSGRQPAGGRHRATQSRPETGSPHGMSRFRPCPFRREGRYLFPAMDGWLMEGWANFSTECIILQPDRLRPLEIRDIFQKYE
jgi:hypothetical protein